MDDETVNEVTLWGEYETPTSSSQLNKEALNNVEYEVIVNSLKNANFKKNFFNSSKETNFPPIKKEIEFVKLDSVMKNVIKMMKYKEEVKEIVERGKLRRDIIEIDNQLRLLPLPRLLQEGCEPKPSKQVVLETNSNFTNGVWTEKPLSITAESTLNILSTSIATVLSYIGFTETNIVPLQVLTEVTENYIIRMLRLLHHNVEKEDLHGESGFCDVMDRTFHEMGIGSLRNLIKYYQKSIVNHKKKKLAECKEELCECEDTIENLRDELQQIKNQNI